MLGFAQLMMHKTEIVGASDQIHARLKSFEAMGGMTRSAGHARQSLPERGIQAFNKSGVEDGTPSRSLQQGLGLREQTMSHPPRDLDDPFFLRALDHRANVQLRPDLQACSSHPRRSLDLLAERSADAARVCAPAVCQHEQGTQASRASANLGQQAISQAAITRVLDRTSQPEASRNHHGQSHPGDHFASFHPNFIGLNVHQVQLPVFNDLLMHLVTMRSRSIAPIRHRPFIQAKSMDNSLKRASIGEQGHHNHDELHRFTQALEHRCLSGAERFFARFAAIALPFAIMDDDVAQTSLASCRTHRIGAKCFRRVHWLWCTLLHKHILPGTLDFFNSPPPHRLVGSYLRRPSSSFCSYACKMKTLYVFSIKSNILSDYCSFAGIDGIAGNA